MEKLNSDEKMSVLMKLEGKEINRVCQTSKHMARICNDERYDPLWRNKIKEEFDVEYTGSLPYEKYKFLYQLRHMIVYVVEILNLDELDRPSTSLFYSLEAAKNYFIQVLLWDDYITDELEKDEAKISKEVEDMIKFEINEDGNFDIRYEIPDYHIVYYMFTNFIDFDFRRR